MLNRGDLTVLVHPETGDQVADHTAHALWLGPPLPLDIAFLRANP
jgi:DOPA 4,5-dioxygenase